MHESLIDSDSLGRVQHQAFLQKVLELVDFAHVGVVKVLRPNECCQQLRENSSRSPWPAVMEGGGAILKYTAHQNWLFHEVLE